LTIARALARRGVSDVCLIERAALGNEASFAAAGMLAPQAEADSSDEFFALACRSRNLYADFAAALLEETGTDIELDPTGTLYVALTEHDSKEIEARYQWQMRAGLPVEKLTATEARELEPCINPALHAALRFPLDTQVENRRLLSALANCIAGLGVKIVAETEVESVQVRSGRVVGVNTARGEIKCAKAVITAGCWTNFIPVLGIAENPVSPCRIEPVRGQMVCFEAKPQVARHVIYSARGYIVPRRDGRLLAGSTTEDAGFAKHTTGGGINTILRNALEISPGVATLPMVDSWAGLRPHAPDGLPVIGPCDEIAGLFYATGHYRNGILLAPITGELIAQAIVGEAGPVVFAPFSPNRFQLSRAS
jgi:glycine oxidase